MSFCPQELIAAARAALCQMEDAYGMRVVHAALAPAQPDPRESMGEEYQLRVAFVRDAAAYLDVDSELPWQAGSQMLEGPLSRTRMFAVDLREAFAQTGRQGGVMLASAATSPYMDNFCGDVLVRTPAMDDLMRRMAEIGPESRAALRQVLSMHMEMANGAAAGADAGYQAGLSPAQRSAMARGYAALSLDLAIAGGSVPAPEALQPSPSLVERGLDLRSFAGDADISSAVQGWGDAKVAASRSIALAPGAIIGFGGAAFGAAPAPEGMRELGAALNPLIRDLIANAPRSSGGLTAEALTQETSTVAVSTVATRARQLMGR